MKIMMMRRIIPSIWTHFSVLVVEKGPTYEQNFS